jgi:hypothetical protein
MICCLRFSGTCFGSSNFMGEILCYHVIAVNPLSAPPRRRTGRPGRGGSSGRDLGEQGRVVALDVGHTAPNVRDVFSLPFH